MPSMQRIRPSGLLRGMLIQKNEDLGSPLLIRDALWRNMSECPLRSGDPRARLTCV
jgi:hypothetical protein